MVFFSSLPAGSLAFVLADGRVDSNLPFNILKIYFMKKNKNQDKYIISFAMGYFLISNNKKK